MFPDSTPEQKFASMILKMSPKEFDKWAEAVSIEEITKATNMISQANQQLKEQMECIQEELDCEIEEEIYNGNLDDAQSVLSKFTLNGL